jgi:hypothetical protein
MLIRKKLMALLAQHGEAEVHRGLPGVKIMLSREGVQTGCGAACDSGPTLSPAGTAAEAA